jgi:FemAB-related protein (PEP-CTERM system-associated)
MPYFNYGGAVANDPQTEAQLMEAACREAARLGSSHVEFRDDIARDGYPAREDKVNMILALPEDHESLWQAFTAKLRAQVRRPEREHPDVRHGGKEYLDDFYTVFARNMRDLGTPVYGLNFFRNILQRFPGHCHIMVVYHQNRPVAAGFLTGYRDMLEIPWASSLRSVNHLSMNMLLYWHAIRFAIDGGFRYFDFGRSGRNTGTYRFKRQWGAMPKPLYWHYWLREGGELPALNPANPRYALAIRTWKRLPLAVTRWLGPRIVRNLP